MCRLNITDTGPGVGAEPEKWLFKPFERGPSPAAPGTGLGLALSLSLAQLMSGNLYLKESSDQGSSFILELKSLSRGDCSSPVTEPQITQPNPHSRLKRKILYIEDNPTNMQLMHEFIHRIPAYELFEATNAKDGWKLIEANAPDVILLDLHLPDQSGIDLLKQIRTDALTNRIPVIVVSADATDLAIEQTLGLGAQAYITKPINFGELTAELNRAVPIT